MKITIGSDHGAVELKAEVTDVGTFGTESVDYPDMFWQWAGEFSVTASREKLFERG